MWTTCSVAVVTVAMTPEAAGVAVAGLTAATAMIAMVETEQAAYGIGVVGEQSSNTVAA